MPQPPEAPVTLVEYDPAWPAEFEKERARLAETLGEWLAGPIEHIGSTAVPGLGAKPILDIMAPVESLERSRPAIEAARQLHYVYFPYRWEVMHWFCKPSPSMRTHHLHLVPLNSRLWIERLAFRDHLRRHPEVAAEYAALKTSLAARYPNDREAYTDAKAPFVQRVLAAALSSTDDFVIEEALDYDEIHRRGGENCSNDEFALFKCPRCSKIYLLEREVDTVYLEPEDLTRRAPVGSQSFACVGCGEAVPRGWWAGPRVESRFRVTWGELRASGWAWAARRI